MGNEISVVTRREFLGAIAATALLAGHGQIVQAEDAAAPQNSSTSPTETRLDNRWLIQSSAVAKEKGSDVASSAYSINGWYAVSVPCTVLAGLVANGEYPDLFVGDNLTKVPEERFASSWWYRKEFSLAPLPADGKAWLYFKGVNYRANVWLNGKQIATGEQLVGTYRDVELDITDAARDQNVLAVEVFAPDPKRDLTITFVDWAPAAPDRNMGIWQDVLLRTSGPVTIRHPYVQTDVDVPSLAAARLTVMADVKNASDKPVTATIAGEIGSIAFSRQVKLDAGETQTVSFNPADFPQLAISNPQIWWPWQLGEPNLQQLNLRVTVDNNLSDQRSLSFGIRKITSRLQNGHRLFTVNGVDLLILGGGYAPDLLQRRDQQEQHLRYLKAMNLNTVRLEGKLEDDAFYDLCDRFGILVMAGWCCCSPWERWKSWRDEQKTVARESLRYQIRRARTHPSLLVWLNGSDNHPPADVEKEYLDIEAELKWPNPILSSATAKKADMSEPTGVKMEGPYQWEPPIFWMTDTKTGGGWGFNTEVGPGPVPPPLESLETMFPPEDRWPINKVWDFHCGRGSFGNINTFLHAQDARFGPSKNLADFSWKAQAQAYETIRAMYEAFRRNKFNATGHIQWMLNNAWPSLIWHLYDYYLRPGAAYFATKLACAPLHVLYSYDNQSIWVANDSLRPLNNAVVTVEIFDINGQQKHHATASISVPANSSTAAMTLPAITDISSTYFVRLTLTGSDGATIDINSYYLSTKPDVMGENGGDDSWFVTPVASFTDYTLLEQLPKVDLSLTEFLIEKNGNGDERASTKVTNTSPAIAAMVRLKLTQGAGGEEILPIRWDDNYFMLFPKESRQIGAWYRSADAKGKPPVVSVDCYNNGRQV